MLLWSADNWDLFQVHIAMIYRPCREHYIHTALLPLAQVQLYYEEACMCWRPDTFKSNTIKAFVSHLLYRLSMSHAPTMIMLTQASH